MCDSIAPLVVVLGLIPYAFETQESLGQGDVDQAFERMWMRLDG
mgnify:FL=1